MIAEDAGRRFLAAYQPAETFRDDIDICDRQPTCLPAARQHAYAESVSYATRAAREASNFNPVRIFHEVFLETCFAQEVSVLL